MFFDFGMYAKHLRPYLQHFGGERVLAIRSESFFADSWQTVRRVLEFRGIAITPGFEAAIKAAKQVKRNAGRKWNEAYAEKLQPLERMQLPKYYAPYTRELYSMLGSAFGTWE